MDFKEKFKNDPERKKLLQQIINAHDNAIISHQLDENEEIIVVYDKYSAINISKLTSQLTLYEQMKYPEIFMRSHPNCRSHNNIIIDGLNTEKEILMLENQLREFIENEDFEKCEMLQNKINKLKK